MNRVKADFAVRINADNTAEVGRSTVEFPRIQWNGKGIKWYDENQLIHQEPTYRVYTTNKSTRYRAEIIMTGLTESQAEAICESWGWNYVDESGRSYWIDYEVEH